MAPGKICDESLYLLVNGYLKARKCKLGELKLAIRNWVSLSLLKMKVGDCESAGGCRSQWVFHCRGSGWNYNGQTGTGVTGKIKMS